MPLNFIAISGNSYSYYTDSNDDLYLGIFIATGVAGSYTPALRVDLGGKIRTEYHTENGNK